MKLPITFTIAHKQYEKWAKDKDGWAIQKLNTKAYKNYQKYKNKEIEVNIELLKLIKDSGYEIIISDSYVEMYDGYKE